MRGGQLRVTCAGCESVMGVERWRVHDCSRFVAPLFNHHPCRCHECSRARVRWAGQQVGQALGDALRGLAEALRPAMEDVARAQEKQQQRAQQARRGALEAGKRRRPRRI